MTRSAYKRYLRSPHWQDVRRRFWASKYPKKCYCCGAVGAPLDLHHKTYKRLGKERLGDLILLCRPCHDEVHEVVRSRSRKGALWSAARLVRKRKERRSK